MLRLPGRPPLPYNVLTLPLKVSGLKYARNLADVATHRRAVAGASADALQPYVLDPATRARLAGLTLDVYPWDTGYMAANPDLRWRPRPSGASFASYPAAIDAMNAQYLRSPGRPQRILWWLEECCQSIDYRHVFWDEPATLLEIIRAYELDFAEPRFLVLRAASRRRLGGLREIRRDRLSWGEWRPAPSARRILLIRADLGLSLPGRVREFFFRLNPVYVGVRFVKGDEAKFRIPPSSLSRAAWLNPLPVSSLDLQRVFSSDSVSGRGVAQRVAEMRLTTDEPGWSWRNPVELAWYTVDRDQQAAPETAVSTAFP